MFEESMSVVPSMWGVMSSWCTPTMLFVLLNFMIATIFVTSGFASHKQPQRLSRPDLLQQQPQLLHRSPSMLQRLKSINFYQYANYYRSEPAAPAQDSYGYEAPMQTSQVMTPETEAASYRVTADEPSEYEAEHDEDEYEVEDNGSGQQNCDKSLDEVYSQLQQGSHFNWSKPDTEPAPMKKMMKSASSKAAFLHSGEEEMLLEARRPATVREAKAKSALEGEDEEVDSKADDFINRFKQHLKLQRLDSILRYKEMLGRGAA